MPPTKRTKPTMSRRRSSLATLAATPPPTATATPAPAPADPVPAHPVPAVAPPTAPTPAAGPGRLSVSWPSRQLVDTARGACVIDRALGTGPDTFYAWIETTTRAWAAHTPDQRARIRPTLEAAITPASGGGRQGTSNYTVNASVFPVIDDAIRADVIAGHGSRSTSRFVAEAAAHAIAETATRTGHPVTPQRTMHGT